MIYEVLNHIRSIVTQHTDFAIKNISDHVIQVSLPGTFIYTRIYIDYAIANIVIDLNSAVGKQQILLADPNAFKTLTEHLIEMNKYYKRHKHNQR